MATPTLVAVTDNSSPGTATLSIAVPAGVADGDILVLIASGETTRTITTPTGWTHATGSPFATPAGGWHTTYIFYRTAASEPGSYNVTQSSSGAFSLAMAAFRNSAGVGNISGDIVQAATNAAPSITLSTNSTMLSWWVLYSNATFTGPGVGTQIINRIQAGGWTQNVVQQDGLGPGASTPLTGTQSNGSFYLAAGAIEILASVGAAYTLTVDVGTYAVSGQVVGLLAARLVAAATGTYALTGQDVTIKAGRLMTADSGAMALTGRDVALLYGRLLAAAAGTYTLTGRDVALLLTRSLAVDAATMVASGQSVALLVGRLMTVGAAAMNLSGKDVTLLARRLIAAATGTYTLTGQDVTLFAAIVYNDPAALYHLSSFARATGLTMSRAVALNTTYAYTQVQPLAGEASQAVIISPGYTRAESIDHV